MFLSYIILYVLYIMLIWNRIKRSVRTYDCPSHESRLLHCLLLLNRQRQSPRRYDKHFPKETYIIQSTAPSPGYISCLQGLNRIDVITPGASTVATFKTIIVNFARFDSSQTQRRVNAIMYFYLNLCLKASSDDRRCKISGIYLHGL